MDDIVKWIEARLWWEILGGSIAAAFLLQVILTRIILVFTAKTKFEIDDKIVAAVRWPLFFSILFVGIYYTLFRLQPGKEALLTVGRILGTLAILLWMKALMRIGDEVCDALSRFEGLAHRLQHVRTIEGVARAWPLPRHRGRQR